MKIIIVGSNAVWAIENYYATHLNEMGVQAEIFNCSNYYRSKAIINRILNRVRIRTIFKNVNTELINLCDSVLPDIIWVFKGVEIYNSTLITLRTKGVKLINYNPDHPIIRSSISHGGKHMLKAIPLYDAHFSYSVELKKYIQNTYKIPTYLLPFAYEPSEMHYLSEINSLDLKRVCMVGNADRIRSMHVKELLKNNLEVDLYGAGWNRYLEHNRRCRIYPPIYGYTFWEVLKNYRVQLNVFRLHNVGSHNMRTFEIPSVGGIQLAPNSEEHRRFFKEGEEIWLYNDIHEMVEMAKKIMEWPEEEVAIHRIKARMRCQQEDYKYVDRAQKVKASILEVLVDAE